MSYLNTPQAGAPTTPIGPAARRWAPLIGFVASLLVLTLIGAVAALRPAASSAQPQPIILIATAVRPSPLPTMAPAPRAVLARFDYTDPASAAALLDRDIARVVGQADGWYLVETSAISRVWVQLADVPAGTPSDAPLADLAPKPTPQIIYVMVAAPANDQAAAPTAPPAPTSSIVFDQRPIDQADPRCTGALDDTIGADCGLSPALLREAEQH